MTSAPTRWHQALSALLRPKQPETGKVRLTRKRIYILPTYAGLVFAITLISMLTGAINYNLSLGHALVFLLASLGLVSMLHTYRNLVGLEIEAGSADPVHAGEQARFKLMLHNPNPYPRIAIEWGERRQAHRQFIPDLPPGSTTNHEIAIVAPERGRLLLPALKIGSRYPLGFFFTWAQPWLYASCMVYPSPLFTPLPMDQGQGDEGHAYYTEGQEDFAGFRERQAADPIRHIVWKAAAKDMGEKPLLIKRFSGGSQSSLSLHWDATSGNTEHRLSILTGWVLDAEADGFVYGLSIPGKTLPPSRGQPHQQACLEALALYQDE